MESFITSMLLVALLASGIIIGYVASEKRKLSAIDEIRKRLLIELDSLIVERGEITKFRVVAFQHYEEMFGKRHPDDPRINITIN